MRAWGERFFVFSFFDFSDFSCLKAISTGAGRFDPLPSLSRVNVFGSQFSPTFKVVMRFDEKHLFDQICKKHF